MTGNLWEWTASLYRPYPYHPNDRHEDAESAEDLRVMRGGSWLACRIRCRCASRGYGHPGDRNDGVGFRLCCAPPVR